MLQRRLKTKQKGSANWLKLQKKIARVYQRIADIRSDWHFKLAHHLCDGAGMLFVEDLDLGIMAKGMLGKHTLDAGLGQFTNQILPWVCFKQDVYYDKVDVAPLKSARIVGLRFAKTFQLEFIIAMSVGQSNPVMWQQLK